MCVYQIYRKSDFFIYDAGAANVLSSSCSHSRAGLQRGVYAVGDELGRPAKAAYGPVGRVALRHVGGPGMVPATE